MMKWIREKMIIIVIFVMMVVCTVAFAIAVKVSMIMIERRNQAIGHVAAQEVQNILPEDRPAPVNTNKLTDVQLYFNGEKMGKASAFLTEKKELLLSWDTLLKRMGVPYKYFASDDMMEADVFQNKVAVKTEKNGFWLNGREIGLETPVVAARNHVLVPQELLSNMEKFKVDSFTEKSVAFLNVHPQSSDDLQDRLKVLKLAGGIGEITDASGAKAYWARKEGAGRGDAVEFSGEGKWCLLKAAGKVYVIDEEKPETPVPVEVDPSATLSQDGRYLYWIDFQNRTSYIYDIGSGKTQELGDYYFRNDPADEDGYLPNGGEVLFDYAEEKGFKRVSLTNVSGSAVYTFIERNGKLAVKGIAFYSPDKKKLLLKRGTGYYLANPDGTDIVPVGTEARWIGNNRIAASSGQENFLTDRNGKNKTKTDETWRMVGKSSREEVFFTDNHTLYAEADGKEHEIAKFPWRVDAVYGVASDGPLVIVSKEQDTVYFVKNEKTVVLGSYSLLLRGKKRGQIFLDPSKSIAFSPAGDKIALFQRENGFAVLYMISAETGLPWKKFTLNCDTSEPLGVDPIYTRWLSESRLLVYTYRSGWVVDMGEEAGIFNWIEPKGTVIRKVLYN